MGWVSSSVAPCFNLRFCDQQTNLRITIWVLKLCFPKNVHFFGPKRIVLRFLNLSKALRRLDKENVVHYLNWQ